MQKIKKDNLTDLIDDVTKPQEASPKPNEGNPQSQPSEGLDDYQVTTPDGEIIDLALLKSIESGNIKQIRSGVDKEGNQYILVIERKVS